MTGKNQMTTPTLNPPKIQSKQNPRENNNTTRQNRIEKEKKTNKN